MKVVISVLEDIFELIEIPIVSDEFYFFKCGDFYWIFLPIERKNVIAAIDHTLIMLGWQGLTFRFYKNDL